MAPRLRASQVASTINTYLTAVPVLVCSPAIDVSPKTHRCNIRVFCLKVCWILVTAERCILSCRVLRVTSLAPYVHHCTFMGSTPLPCFVLCSVLETNGALHA